MYNGCISVGDHSVAACQSAIVDSEKNSSHAADTHTLEMLARHLSNGTPLLEVASMRFRVIDPFVAPYQRMFIKLRAWMCDVGVSTQIELPSSCPILVSGLTNGDGC